MFKYAISIGLIFTAILLQFSEFNLYEIKPNMVLSVLMVLVALTPSFADKIALIIIASVGISFYPTLIPLALIFFAVSFGLAVFIEYLPSTQFINSILAVALGTLILNLDNFSIYPVLIETSYNLILTVILFVLLSDKIGHEKDK